MKLTKKTVKQEVETTEVLCEITQNEFEKKCAETAAATVVRVIGDNPDIDDFMAAVAMTDLFAEFAAELTQKLFNDTDKTENPDKKEEK